MRLAELMTEDGAILDFSARDKWEAIEKILDHLIERGLVVPERRGSFLDALVRRENLASTGMGDGVALPHAQVDQLDEAVMAVAISSSGVPFQSSDGSLARILVLLVIPKQKVRSHVRTLAGIARLLNCEAMRQALIQAKTPAALVRIIRDEEAKGLAGVPTP